MSKEDYGRKGKEAFYWVVFAEAAEFFLRFGSSIILARILFPDDFGLMGLASIAIQFSRRLTQFGLTSVLVQIKDIKDDHYHTVFWTNMLTMSFVSAVVFFGAPHYAEFFGKPVLIPILWVIAIDFVLQAFSAVPTAILRRNLRFKELAFSHTISKIATIVVAIGLAVMGYGVWALVWGEVAGSLASRSSAIRYALRFSDWKPKFRYKKWALKDTFSFGLWMYVNAYVTYGINKVDYFFIGKFLGATALGFYERAFDLMSMPRKRLVRKMNTVAYSTYSRLQDDSDRLIRGLLQVTRHLSVVTYPLMIWLFFASPSLIVNLYGEKWMETIIPLQIMCISGLIDSFTLIFQPLLKATGYIGNNTRRDILYLAILTLGVLGGIFYFGTIAGVAIGIVFASIIRLLLTMTLTAKKLPLNIWHFFGAQRSAIVYGMIQIALLWTLKLFVDPLLGETSLVMFALISLLSIIALFGSHYVIRFQDIDEIITDLTKDLRKTARKIPVIKNLPFVKNKSKKPVKPTPDIEAPAKTVEPPLSAESANLTDNRN